MSLLFNMLSRLVITFLPRSKCLLISWLQLPSAVILEPQKIKSDTVYTVFPSICHEVMGPVAMILVFWVLSFKPTFSLSSFTFIKTLFSSSSLSAIKVVSSVLCPMSKSLSRNREAFQDNTTHKKRSLLLTWARAPAASNAVVQGQRAQSPSCYTNLKGEHKQLVAGLSGLVTCLQSNFIGPNFLRLLFKLRRLWAF